MWVALVLACRLEDPTGPGGATSPPPTGHAELDATCGANPVVPAVLDCTWTSAEPGVGTVEVWPAGAPEAAVSTPPGPEGTSHDVAVLGLKAGASYELRVVVQAGDHRLEGPVVEHVVPEVPPEFPELTLVESDPARSEIAHGYLLLAVAVMNQAPRFTAVAIVDGEGDYVWWVRSDDDALAIAPALSRDGHSVGFLTSDMTWTSDVGAIHHVSLDGDEVGETRARLGHHAFVEDADGALTFLDLRYATVDGVDWAADGISTVPRGSGEEVAPTSRFDWFSAYPVDPWVEDPQRAVQVRYGEGIEWTHSNSLMAIDDSSLYVMAKHLDCVVKVDRASGAIVWQLGGRYGDFTHPDGTPPWRSALDQDLFSQPHMSHVWDGGMVVFDNGDLYTPPRSRAVELRFDEAARTVEQVWEYVEPTGGHTASMGDVRRLDGGNTLIAWNALEYVNEVTPEGDTVWRLEMSGVGAFGRVTPIRDLYDP